MAKSINEFFHSVLQILLTNLPVGY